MRIHPQVSRATGAFTLIEMILVMTILTVAVGLTAPALSKFFRGRTLNSEARRFLSLARHGQERAISEGLPMDLWVDAARGRFGLEAEPSYAPSDPLKVEFTLDQNLRLETVTTNTAARTASRSKKPGSAPARAPSRNSNLPAIRFLPDGTIEETSPHIVRLIENDGFTITIEQSRNRLGYEISSDAR